MTVTGEKEGVGGSSSLTIRSKEERVKEKVVETDKKNKGEDPRARKRSGLASIAFTRSRHRPRPVHRQATPNKGAYTKKDRLVKSERSEEAFRN